MLDEEGAVSKQKIDILYNEIINTDKKEVMTIVKVIFKNYCKPYMTI